jgi:ribosome-binding ATPase YchF (GTP1/OBG family)
MFRALTGGLSQNDQKNRFDPGLGVVKVADSRLDFLTKYHKPKKVTPVHVEYLDVAGITGEGNGCSLL